MDGVSKGGTTQQQDQGFYIFRFNEKVLEYRSCELQQNVMKDFQGIKFRERALYKVFGRVNVKFALSKFFSQV